MGRPVPYGGAREAESPANFPMGISGRGSAERSGLGKPSVQQWLREALPAAVPKRYVLRGVRGKGGHGSPAVLGADEVREIYG
ncbi:hypothetical protein BRADI_1g41855v3 [Brachypodium distachyon]|uniref:Uncharacterized protein n=1 Tax=Brachypodium distachyon TaxID=15368 RepID=A0A2K2DNS1_BRADI|nr:hypothetical protein BRADI_1g41855v3 [Brachypodium distachyon]